MHLFNLCFNMFKQRIKLFLRSASCRSPDCFFEPVFIPDALCPPMNGVPGRDVLRIATGSELLELIRRNREDAAELNRFLDSFLDHVAPEYMGALDGEAGARLMRHVLEHY